MRLWSLHPKYLDSKGLLAVWREGLLAKKVLQGKTTGYKKHPQLIRFKNHQSAVGAINYYLFEVYRESLKRGYKFNNSKIGFISKKINKIPVNLGQIDFEWKHLKKKLTKRNKNFFEKLKKIFYPQTHPLFIIVKGEIESWEKQS